MDVNHIKNVFDKSCLRKQNLTKEEADRIVDYCANFKRELMFYYKCVLCGSYHMTSSEPQGDHKIKVRTV